MIANDVVDAKCSVELITPVVNIINPPSFEEVYAASIKAGGGNLTLHLVSFGHSNQTIQDGDSVHMRVKDVTVSHITDLKYDSSERGYSFRGEHTEIWEHDSYGQSSRRTTITSYRVEVRGQWVSMRTNISRR